MRSEADDDRAGFPRREIDAHPARPRSRPRHLAFRHFGLLAPAPHRGGDDAADRAGHRRGDDAARPQSGRRGPDSRLARDRNYHAVVHHRQRLAHENRHAGGDRGLPASREAEACRHHGQQLLLRRGRAGFDLRDFQTVIWSVAHVELGTWPLTATARLVTARLPMAAVAPPPTDRPIRSKTTPTTSSWSARAAPVCARWSAAAKPGCAPPASPRYFRPARIPSQPKAASPPRSATCIRTTGAGICTTPSRGRTGWGTRTPSNIWCATRPRRSTNSNIGACRSRAPKTARSISGRSAA